MTKQVAEYKGEELSVFFTAYLEHHEEGDELTNITFHSATLLGHSLDITILPEGMQASIIALGDELEDWEDFW